MTNTFEIPIPDDKTNGIIDAKSIQIAVNGGRMALLHERNADLNTEIVFCLLWNVHDYGITEARYLRMPKPRVQKV